MEGPEINIKVVTDSTSYIPKDMIDKYDISVISLGVSFPEESCRELDIDNSTFYERMSRCKSIPTSSQPSIKEVTDIFERIASDGSQAVGIFLSSKMSGTYSSTFLARDMVKEKYPDAVIELLDSTSNCMQLGFAVLAAAKAAYEGASIDTVIGEAKDVIEKSRFLFVPDTL